MRDERDDRLMAFLSQNRPKPPDAPDDEYERVLSRLRRPSMSMFLSGFRPYALAAAAAVLAAVFLFTFDRTTEDVPTALETFFDDTVGDFFASENPDEPEPGESLLLLADLSQGNTMEDLNLEMFLDQSLDVLHDDVSETDSWLF